jgi:hypothetical protein
MLVTASRQGSTLIMNDAGLEDIAAPDAGIEAVRVSW